MSYRYLFVLFLAVTACRTIEPAIPETKIQLAPMPEQPVSTIVLPVSIDLTPYYALADKQVPYAFDGSDHPCSGVSFDYHFERDPLKLTGNGREIAVDVSGKYSIRMSYCPECTDLFSEKPYCITPRIPFSCGIGEPMRRMKMRYVSGFELTKNYGIVTHTRLEDVKAIDPCEVTVFSYDATEELLKEVRKALTSLAKDIDKQTAGISLKPQAAKLWKSAGEPIAVPGFGFIYLKPKKIRLTQPVLANNLLTGSLILEARPVFGTHRQNVSATPLPDLEFSNGYQTDTLQLFSDLNLQYDSLSAIINRYVSGTELLIQKNKVIIDSVNIAGADDRNLIFRVKFSGKKRGTLYIIGQPDFNSATQQIELKNVAFDLQTKSALLKTAKWLFSDRILQEISKNCKQDLAPQLELLRKGLNKSLHITQYGFKLDGNILQLRVEEVYPETENLVIRVAAKGKLFLTSVSD